MSMKVIYDTIIKVVNTEKSAIDLASGKYYFEVSLDSTKDDVKKATEKIFGVKVKKVNIINFKGKIRRFKGHTGRKKNVKRAIVSLEEGQSINYTKVN